jgi:hypothetical protein
MVFELNFWPTIKPLFREYILDYTIKLTVVIVLNKSYFIITFLNRAICECNNNFVFINFNVTKNHL